MGCSCYQKTVDVRGALLEALDDCTEEVRFTAATALYQVAGNPCSQCGGTCCNAVTMNKLQEHASGKDASGCFKEPSEQRAANVSIRPGRLPAETAAGRRRNGPPALAGARREANTDHPRAG